MFYNDYVLDNTIEQSVLQIATKQFRLLSD